VALCTCEAVRGLSLHRLADLLNGCPELRRRQSVKIICPECRRPWSLQLCSEVPQRWHKIPRDDDEAAS
jgi:hypothetical protein